MADLCDRIEIRRLMTAIGGGFDVNSRQVNKAFCACLAEDVIRRPLNVVLFERAVGRIRAMSLE